LGEDSSEDESLDEDWKITDEMKESLRHSSWLKEELEKSSGLESLIRSLVSHGRHRDAGPIFEEAKQKHPALRVFLDKMLVVAGVLEREGDETLGDWLEQEEDTSNLRLKTVGRKPMPVFEPVDISSSTETESSSEDEESEDTLSHSSNESE